MNCGEFQELMQKRLDGDFAGEASGQESHLASCGPCRSLQTAVERLERGLRLLPPGKAPEGLSERIVHQIFLERRAGWRYRRFLLPAAALAAGLLLAVFIGIQRNQEIISRPALAPVVDATPPPQESPPPISLNKSIDDASAALVALVNRTAGETVGQGRLLWPKDISAAVMEVDVGPWQQSLETPAQSLLEAGQGVSAGLEPVTASARRAVNLFLRDLPPMNY